MISFKKLQKINNDIVKSKKYACSKSIIRDIESIIYKHYENDNKIKYVSNLLNIDINRFSPKDIKGISHPLGVFEIDGEYIEFITQGAKKYAYKDDEGLHITVSGVPKKAKVALKKLEDFKDGYIFKYKDTNKNTLFYTENQAPFELVDYLGNKCVVNDISGVCLVPTTYELGKSLDYANLISDESSKRAIYKEV